MHQVIGLTAAKVNGLYRVDVKNLRWRVQRNVTQNVTQGGVKESIGIYLVSGSFEEVIPKTGIFNWNALTDFAVQFYDFETRSVLIFAAEGCNVESLDGNSDLGSASASKSIAWKGTLASTF